MEWPSDLEDKDVMSLRDDVKRFIWNILDEVIPPERYCNMHYFGAIKSQKESLPIVVEVTEDYVEKVNDRIATISDQLRASNCEGLLPVDLVEIKGVPVRYVIASGFVLLVLPGKKELLEES